MATEAAITTEEELKPAPPDAADEASDILKQEVAKARQAADMRTRSVEQRLAEMAADKDRVEKELRETRTSAATSQVEAYTRDIDSAKSELRQAHEAGDFNKVVEAQEKLNAAQINKREYERQKAEFERQPVRQAPQQVPLHYSSDPAEQLAREIESHSPNSAEWVRQHPEFARDEGMKERMVAAHDYAIGQGARPDSPLYLQMIEQKLEITKAEPKSTGRVPAAPVSRSGTQAPRASTAGKVALTQEEKDTAADLGIPEERYAFNKAQLIAEGRYNRADRQ